MRELFLSYCIIYVIIIFVFMWHLVTPEVVHWMTEKQMFYMMIFGIYLNILNIFILNKYLGISREKDKHKP